MFPQSYILFLSSEGLTKVCRLVIEKSNAKSSHIHFIENSQPVLKAAYSSLGKYYNLNNKIVEEFFNFFNYKEEPIFIKELPSKEIFKEKEEYNPFFKEDYLKVLATSIFDSKKNLLGTLSSIGWKEWEINDTEIFFFKTIADILGLSLDYHLTLKKMILSEESMKEIINNIEDIIYFQYLDGSTSLYNKSIEHISGYRLKEFKKNPFLFLNIMHPLDRESIESFFKKREKPVSSFQLEYRLIKKDGKQKWISSKRIAKRNKKGEIIGYNCFDRDITTQKELEEQLSQSQKMETVGQLAGGIAHDFNNILGAILGYANMLKHELPTDSKLFHYAKSIEESAVKAAELTHQLLAYSRQGKYNPEPVNFNTIIKNSINILSHSIKNEIDTFLFLDDDLLSVEADRTQMEQMIMNICLNANDAMPNGGKLTITTKNIYLDREFLKNRPKSRPGKYVMVEISDTGIGMSEKIKQKIFEPFFTTKKEGKGTGLGLSMVYGIVKNHNGFIDVESEEGVGTKFTIYFPATTEKEIIKQWETSITPTGNNELILIIDDDKNIRDLLEDLLVNNGYRAASASNGEEGVKLFNKFKEDVSLIILDLVMPGMNGEEVFIKLKELDPFVKVIISTGYASEEQASRMLKQGAKGLLRKPYKASQFLLQVRETIDNV